MDPSCLVSTVQAAAGVIMVIFSWHTLGPLVPIERCLNTTAYLSIVAENCPSFYDHSVSFSDENSNHLKLVS